jgi:hypothetical protein
VRVVTIDGPIARLGVVTKVPMVTKPVPLATIPEENVPEFTSLKLLVLFSGSRNSVPPQRGP